MKFLFLIVALTLFVSAQALTETQKNILRANAKICIGETGASKDLIKRFKGGDFGFSDDKTNAFVFCMFKKSGLIEENGKFLKDVALAKVDPSIRDAVSKAIDACIDKVGSTPAETAWNYAKCYHKVRPQHDFL